MGTALDAHPDGVRGVLVDGRSGTEMKNGKLSIFPEARLRQHLVLSCGDNGMVKATAVVTSVLKIKGRAERAHLAGVPAGGMEPRKLPGWLARARLASLQPAVLRKAAADDDLWCHVFFSPGPLGTVASPKQAINQELSLITAE